VIVRQASKSASLYLSHIWVDILMGPIKLAATLLVGWSGLEARVKIGYARTSTVDQQAGLDAQIRELSELGCKEIFREQISGAQAARPQLAAAIAYLREGDTLVATKIDRLARSVGNLCQVIEEVRSKGANLLIPQLGSTDPGTPIGGLLVNVLGAIAEFERQLMLERQREGIAAAKADGKYKGRKPTARAKGEIVRKLAAEGVSKVEIARRLGIGEASVYRILAAAQRVQS
jgi:DNA invertase Pin-like site-specific DNA recombinase